MVVLEQHGFFFTDFFSVVNGTVPHDPGSVESKDVETWMQRNHMYRRPIIRYM